MDLESIVIHMDFKWFGLQCWPAQRKAVQCASSLFIISVNIFDAGRPYAFLTCRVSQHDGCQKFQVCFRTAACLAGSTLSILLLFLCLCCSMQFEVCLGAHVCCQSRLRLCKRHRGAEAHFLYATLLVCNTSCM